MSVDERDNDPKVLLTHVAEALDEVDPIDGRAFEALAAIKLLPPHPARPDAQAQW